MSVKFANNAFGTLNAGINNSATSLTLSSGQGARFPTLVSGDYFYATLIDTSNNLEVVKCTARSTDVLTVTRAQENTTAQAFAIGDRIELRITAGGLEDVAALATLDADPSPQLSADLDLNSNDITGTGDINTTGDLTATGDLNVDGRDIVPLAKGDEMGTTDDWNTVAPNAVGYYQGGGAASNNGSFTNNGVYMYLSSRYLDGTHDDATDERAAQLYFGDTIVAGNGGFHYRVKQGTSGWHDWGRVLTSTSKGSVVQTAFDTTDAITATTSQSGFTALETALTPTRALSRMLVISNVYGSANDDAHAWLEYKIGAGGWTRNTNLNGNYNSGMAMGDYSIIRGFAEPDQPIGFGTSVVWHPNTTSEVRIRVICSAENTNGFNLNIGTSRDTASSYNNTTAKSTLVIQEIAWE